MTTSYFAECTVLITGASAGLGREFARQLAPAVNTMILVARRHDRLEALERELKMLNPKLEVFCRQVDLRHQPELEHFCNWLEESDLAVDFLINNAGLGDHGPFIDSSWDKVQAMLQVNIGALTYLTYRLLPSMRRAGCGAILNVSSSAGFLPLPRLAVYAATKAYVTSFSEALRAELRLSNISVTALCPGPVPTEFFALAERSSGRMAAAPEAVSVPVYEVVRQGLHAVVKDRARVIPGRLVHFGMTVVAFVPMFVKRLFYSAQLQQTIGQNVPNEPDYQPTETTH